MPSMTTGSGGEHGSALDRSTRRIRRRGTGGEPARRRQTVATGRGRLMDGTTWLRVNTGIETYVNTVSLVRIDRASGVAVEAVRSLVDGARWLEYELFQTISVVFRYVAE